MFWGSLNPVSAPPGILPHECLPLTHTLFLTWVPRLPCSWNPRLTPSRAGHLWLEAASHSSCCSAWPSAHPGTSSPDKPLSLSAKRCMQHSLTSHSCSRKQDVWALQELRWAQRTPPPGLLPVQTGLLQAHACGSSGAAVTNDLGLSP